MNFDNSQFEIKGNVERRSVEVYSFYNDILSAELSIQHPISKQSKAYIRGGEFGDSAFFYAFENVITTRIAESQMLKSSNMKNKWFLMALVAAISFSSCGGNNNAPCADSIAFQEFSSDCNKVSEYIKNEDFVNSRRLLDEICTRYDFSAPTDRNVGFLILLSHMYYWNAVADRIRNDDDLIEKSMELARRAYKINRDSAENIVNKYLETQYEYCLLVKEYVE